MKTPWTLGIDCGSVTVKAALIDPDGELRLNSYHRTDGAPLEALEGAMTEVRGILPKGATLGAVGTTGSGRELAGAMLGADVVKNEITTHAVGALSWNPKVRTIIEIGGQDSKLIHLNDGIVMDFAMNTVCAAGTGAFLDQQALRLQIPIERFGDYALSARKPVRIAGRCSVFAESDMIHKQQVGHDRAGICLGLCQALVRNYLNNLAGGKRIASPVSFQGGVSNNKAILHCFREALPDAQITVPPVNTGCGAYGAALLAREAVRDRPTRFRGWDNRKFGIREQPCPLCTNQCDILVLEQGGNEIARWGGRCEKFLSLRNI